MTEEEAKEYLDNYRKLYTELAPERFLEALDIMLNEPVLPSNLDEAAKEYSNCPFTDDEGDLHNASDLNLYDAFKAGAEWMAGQGETFNGYISIKGKRSLIAIEGKSDINKFGDKVIVQVRKK